MKNYKLFIFVILSIFLSSCADKKDDYDKKKAISAFDIIDSLKVDKQLEKEILILPKQQPNNIWNGSVNSTNQRIENIAKVFLKEKPFFSKVEKISLKEVSQTWSNFSYNKDDDFVFSPIIKDNKIFLLNTSGMLSSFDLKTKKRLWKSNIFETKLLKNYQSPKIFYDDDKIFAVAGINKIVAANAKNGKLLWSKEISSIPVSAAISDGKLVFVTTNDNKIYALNAINGELQWTVSGILRTTAIFGAADPVLYNDLIIASFSSGEIYAINKNNSEILWSQDLNLNRAVNSDFYLNDIDATPVIKDDILYSIGNGGLMVAINIKNGNYLWKKEIAGITDFWLAHDYLYVINNENRFMAINRHNGGIKWISQLPNLKKDKKPQSKFIYNGVVMAGNKLIISNNDGDILLVSPVSGKVEKTYETGEKTYHAPAIVDDKIYLHRVGFFTIDLLELK